MGYRIHGIDTQLGQFQMALLCILKIKRSGWLVLSLLVPESGATMAWRDLKGPRCDAIGLMECWFVYRVVSLR
ncbi:MAG: hypothetical protein C9356_14110 [Oleiphilus sp.]|nr:MAG: hypothetical protein C9356_14110 [Oleiphilus sp.]